MILHQGHTNGRAQADRDRHGGRVTFEVSVLVAPDRYVAGHIDRDWTGNSRNDLVVHGVVNADAAAARREEADRNRGRNGFDSGDLGVQFIRKDRQIATHADCFRVGRGDLRQDIIGNRRLSDGRIDGEGTADSNGRGDSDSDGLGLIDLAIRRCRHEQIASGVDGATLDRGVNFGARACRRFGAAGTNGHRHDRDCDCHGACERRRLKGVLGVRTHGDISGRFDDGIFDVGINDVPQPGVIGDPVVADQVPSERDTHGTGCRTESDADRSRRRSDQ